MSTTQTQLVASTATAPVIATESSIPLTTHSLTERRDANRYHDGEDSSSIDFARDATLPRGPAPEKSKKTFLRSIAVTVQLSGVSLSAAAVNGLVVVGLPKMTEDLNIPPSLAFWPVSAAFMATTASLLLAGSLADIIGPRLVELAGSLASGAFMVGCGLSRQGEELIALRALQGVALALHLASSVSLLTKTWPHGRSRNISFACLGISSVIGFSLGLVLGGIFVDTIGWRAGWYIYGGITLALSVLGFFVLPKTQSFGSFKEVLHGIRTKMDLVGALLASVFMALISYFLA